MSNFLPVNDEAILHDPRQNRWLRFAHPSQVISARRLEEVLPALRQVETLVDRYGHYAAGFLSYEAAPAMEQSFQTRPPDGRLPLLWFGIYPEPEAYPTAAVTGSIDRLPGHWQASITKSDYHHAIHQVRDYIARGETYQVNFTYRLATHASLGDYTQNAWSLFAALAEAHAPPYAAFIQSDEWAICSISPELFFTLDGQTLTSLPMKGTAPRGLTQDEDQALAAWLRSSEKNRAENLMIVDMVRNDMGRVAQTSSVNVPRLFHVDKYPTVWQMISEVQCQTRAGLAEIMQALFPAASITGAPKVRTMQIITELETTPRGIYTGAIGYYAPGRSALFNVAIRTLLIEKQRQQATYGVGGGIVWDSDPAEEWAETITKARILHEPPQPFYLLETMRWTPEEGWYLLAQHLARLEASAAYFAFPFDRPTILQRLAAATSEFQDTPQRMRLLLARSGELTLEALPLPVTAPPRRVALARTPVDSGNRFLYHKTTRRALYQHAMQEQPGFDDVLLFNQNGELTESTIANVFFQQGGRLYTPPVSCGLLPGTYRAWLLETGQVTEKTLHRSELDRCERFFLGNSVRGMWTVEVIDPEQEEVRQLRRE